MTSLQGNCIPKLKAGGASLKVRDGKVLFFSVWRKLEPVFFLLFNVFLIISYFGILYMIGSFYDITSEN